MIFTDHGRHRHRRGRRDASRARRRATSRRSCRSRLHGEGGDRRDGVTGTAAEPADADRRSSPQLFLAYDLTLAEINPLASSRTARSSRSTRHIDMEDEARDRAEDAAEGARHRRRGDAPGARGDAVRDRRRGGRRASTTAASPATSTEFDGNLGLVIGAGGGSLTLFDAVRKHGGKPANYCEIGGNPSVDKACGLTKLVLAEAGRREDRGDDVDRLEHARRHRRARRHQGLRRVAATTRRRRSRSSASPARGRTRASRSSRSTASSTATAPCRCTRRRAAPSRRSGPRPHVHPHRREHDLHRPGHHRPRGGEPDARVPRLRHRPKIVGGVTPGRPAATSTACRSSTPCAGGRAPRRADRRLGRHRPARVHARTRCSRRSRTASS